MYMMILGINDDFGNVVMHSDIEETSHIRSYISTLSYTKSHLGKRLFRAALLVLFPTPSGSSQEPLVISTQIVW